MSGRSGQMCGAHSAVSSGGGTYCPIFRVQALPRQRESQHAQYLSRKGDLEDLGVDGRILKLSLSLIKQHGMRTCGAVEVELHAFLALALSFTPRSFCPHRWRLCYLSCTAVVFNLFCSRIPRCNFSSTFYPHSCLCIIHVIHSL
jgi:hypothetical protein